MMIHGGAKRALVLSRSFGQSLTIKLECISRLEMLSCGCVAENGRDDVLFVRREKNKCVDPVVLVRNASVRGNIFKERRY